MKISIKDVIFEMNKDNKAVLSVDSGARVVFETMDCFSNTVKSEEDLVSAIDFSKVNPATGPLYIKDAKPGDVLKVTIESIELADQGVVLTAPGLGLLADDIEKEETVICRVTNDYVDYKGIQIPLRKMIGVIGTAPAGEGINTGTPGDHGGNMDVTRMGEGAILYLPVNVEGALLALGDLHATMGDGEIMGDGLEIAGQVQVKVEVLEDSQIPLPFLETEDLWISIGSRETMEEASALAVRNMVQFIKSQSSLTSNQAGMLISLAGDLISCQAVNPNMTMRLELPKGILKDNQSIV